MVSEYSEPIRNVRGAMPAAWRVASTLRWISSMMSWPWRASTSAEASGRRLRPRWANSGAPTAVSSEWIALCTETLETPRLSAARARFCSRIKARKISSLRRVISSAPRMLSFP